MVGEKAGHPLPAGRAQVDAVEAAAADVGHLLVAVGLGVPGVATVLLPAQLLPHVQHTAGQAHLSHLG